MFAKSCSPAVEPYDIHLSKLKTLAFVTVLVVLGLALLALSVWLLLMAVPIAAAFIGFMAVILLVPAGLFGLHLMGGQPYASITREGVWGLRSMRRTFVAWSPHCSVDTMNRALVLRRWDPDQSWGERWRALIWGGEAVGLRIWLCAPSHDAIMAALQARAPYPIHEGVPPPPPQTEGEAQVNSVIFHPVTHTIFFILGLVAVVYLGRLKAMG